MQDKLKVVTLYSPSHKEMMEKYFLPSFPEDSRLDLKIVEAPQLAGDKPVFNDPNWKSFMKIKGKLLEDELLSIPENDCYLFLDVDIIIIQNFYDFIMKEIQNCDFIAQSDSPHAHFLNYCTGVIAFKNTEPTRNLLKAMNMFMDKFKQEQESLTYFAANSKKFYELKNLKPKLFKKENAFTYGLIDGRVWNNDDFNFEIPSKEHLYFMHANYCLHDNKPLLLQLFKNKLNLCIK